MATYLLTQDREILPNSLPIDSGGSNLVHLLICYTCCQAPVQKMGSARVLAIANSSLAFRKHTSDRDTKRLFRRDAETSTRDACATQRPDAPLTGLASLYFLVHLRERINRKFQVFARMRGGYLCADARGAMWDDRIKEANHVHAFLQHARSELLRLCSVANHDGDDWMHSWLDRQTTLRQPSAEELCVFLKLVAQFG